MEIHLKENIGNPWQSQWGFNPSTQSDITDWKQVSSLVYPTSSAALLVTKNHIYILGGYSECAIANTIQAVSFNANGDLISNWSIVGTIPEGMHSMGYIVVKNRFYLIGGANHLDGYSTVYSAPINEDGTLGVFRKEKPLPTERYGFVCFVIKDKLYVVGGGNGSYIKEIYRTTINNDGTLNEWEILPDFPIYFDCGTPLIIKNRIYIFGAFDGNNSKIYYAIYDTNGNIGSWNYVGNMPNNIYASALVCTDNYVFSIGGFDKDNNAYTNAAYRAPILADGNIGSWTQISNGPVSVGYSQSAIIGNKIYFIGGWNISGSLNSVHSATFTSGITDYTLYYTDQPNTSPTFNLPDLTSRSNTYPQMKYIIKT
jgi:N-acetylneuraminic acid mutarotase